MNSSVKSRISFLVDKIRWDRIMVCRDKRNEAVVGGKVRLSLFGTTQPCPVDGIVSYEILWVECFCEKNGKAVGE